MKVVVFGGPEDGKTIKVPDNAVAWTFHRFTSPQKSWMPTSPFVPTEENSTPETWKILLKRVHDSTEEYKVIVAPKLESWLLDNFPATDEGKEES